MQNTILHTLEWLAEAADDPRDCLQSWDQAPGIPYPLIIGKTFDLVTTHRRVGERVLAFYDRDAIPAGGALLDCGVAKVGFLVHRDPKSQPLTVALACDARYRTRCLGLKGYLLAPVPVMDEDSLARSRVRWLRLPGPPGTHTFELPTLTAKLAEVASEGVAFPVDDVPPPAPSYQ
ncbi:hypothetical protein [Embleya sp. NBC_00896]|uniref:hypothetical protein n=1 Tax=Embleya sp. NBC_00896 TaxID=2975961 RepID=UPI003864CD6E|nr:hypothetical protein OG928_11720 [Embleya sp. NBC_00896]